MALADNLKKLMEIKQISPFDLSKISGVPQPRISEIVNSKTLNPQLKTLVKLAEALEVEIVVLVGSEAVESKYKQFAEVREKQSIQDYQKRYGVTALFREINPGQEELLRCWDLLDEGKRKSLMDVARAMAGVNCRSVESDQEENPLTVSKSAVK